MKTALEIRINICFQRPGNHRKKVTDKKIKSIFEQRANCCRAQEPDRFKQINQSFFIKTMEIILTQKDQFGFTQMARYRYSCENRIRQNFEKPFEWMLFNKSFLELMKIYRIAIAIDPFYI